MRIRFFASDIFNLTTSSQLLVYNSGIAFFYTFLYLFNRLLKVINKLY